MQDRSPSGNASGSPRQAGLTFPAPFDALWSYRKRPVSDLNLVKAARAAIVWRANPGLASVGQGARYLGWGIWFPIDLLRFVLSRGGDAKKRFGRDYPGQIGDMFKVAVQNGLMPRDYYAGELARHGGGEEILRYLPNRLYESVATHLLGEGSATDMDTVQDKFAFENRCRESGLPVVRTIAIAYPDALRTPSGRGLVEALPPRDLLVKPLEGHHGEGIERWRFVGRGHFAGADGEPLSGHDLMARFCASSLSAGSPILVQLCLENHKEIQPISGSALSTIRVVTILDEQEKPEIVEAYFRKSIVDRMPADHRKNGAELLPIDIATGRISDRRREPPEQSESTEPVDENAETEEKESGEQIPGWEAISALVKRAHRAFANLPLVSLDIGYASDGPIIVKAILPPEISPERQAATEPLIGTRFFALLAFHAGRWLDSTEPEDSRWRCGRETS